MHYLLNKIETYSVNRQLYPAIFRVSLCMLIIIKWFFEWSELNAIYNVSDYLYPDGRTTQFLSFFRSYLEPLSVLYLASLCVYALGLFRYVGALFFLAIHTIFYLMLSPTMVWGEQILQNSLIFFVALDSYRYLTVKNTTGKLPLIHIFAYASLILHIYFIFWANVYQKLNSEEWILGNGIHFFLHSAHVTDVYDIRYFFLNHPTLAKCVNYSIILFQIFLPIGLSIKWSRKYFFVLACCVHCMIAFILLEFKFQIIVLLLCGFFFSDQELLFYKEFITKKINSINLNRIKNVKKN